jgi:hypothetical protein
VEAVSTHESSSAIAHEVRELREKLERLTHLLDVSEQFRQAYADGKYKLYAMGGEICEAAADNLPMSEGPLNRAVVPFIGRPQIRTEVFDAEQLREQNRKLREALSEIASRRHPDCNLALIAAVALQRAALESTK